MFFKQIYQVEVLWPKVNNNKSKRKAPAPILNRPIQSVPQCQDIKAQKRPDQLLFRP